MSLFNKIFGKSDPKDDNSEIKKPDLGQLLASDSLNTNIIELDDYICKLCSWGEELNKLTEEQKNFYFNQNIEREVNNGGFDQYFLNSSGNFAHETVKSLQIIGANKTAVILQDAIDQFPNKSVPSERISRHKAMDQIENEAEEIWGELADRFYLYEDDLNSLNMEYVRANKDKF